jgi:chromosome segregation ATPase
VRPTFDSERGADTSVLESRIESLAAWVGELESRVRTTELATVDEAGARELRRALEAIASHDPDLGPKLEDKIAVVGERLETLSSALASTASALAAKDGEIAELRRRLDEHERRLEVMATAGSPSDHGARDDVRRALAELSARVEALQESEGRRRDDLEGLAARLASSDEHLRSLADDLRRQLEEVASQPRTPAEERLAALEERLAALEHAAAEGEPSAAELARQRAQLEGLRMRVAAAERELASVSSSERLPERIDEVARRLSALEPVIGLHGTGVLGLGVPSPLLEAGRSSAELRALELRLERAEAAERETRLELLAHVERLAQRIEERLASLRGPAEGADPSGEARSDPSTRASQGARVVPLLEADRA